MPTGSLSMCGGPPRGVCATSTGACSCSYGYAGSDCGSCSSGFYRQGTRCLKYGDLEASQTSMHSGFPLASQFDSCLDKVNSPSWTMPTTPTWSAESAHGLFVTIEPCLRLPQAASATQSVLQPGQQCLRQPRTIKCQIHYEKQRSGMGFDANNEGQGIHVATLMQHLGSWQACIVEKSTNLCRQRICFKHVLLRLAVS